MKCINKPRIVLVPYPAQGHVTPMLELASAILIHGYQPVMVIPEFIHRRIVKRVEMVHEEIMCVSIPDGLEEEAPRDFFAIETAMENYMPLHFDRLVRTLNEEDGGGGGVVCVVVDLLASWAIQVADQCGVPTAGFWPAMIATYHLIAAIPDFVSKGLISETGIPKQEGTLCSVLGQPVPIDTGELPWLIGTLAQRKSRCKFWTKTLNRTRTLRWLLVNSFPQEHDYDQQQIESVDHEISKKEYCPLVVPIGPLSKHTMAKNRNPVSFWEEDMSCLDWLDKQDPGSVVYVSFGSLVGSIGENKINDIALGLEASGHPFIWVLRSTWRQGLPEGYLERVFSKQCKIVSWAPQMEVLQHRAVGCYLTHCGWNSTMEAIQCKKRLLCYPVAGDQFLNCAYIVKEWKIGVRLIGDFGRRDVEEGVRRVMDDGEMDQRLVRLYEKTMGEEACSRVVGNLTTFIDNLNKLNSVSSIKVLNGI